MHEASLWPSNCFVTLTYSPENVPSSGSLDPDAFVRFMKRLRKAKGSGVRFFHCGEYGESMSRPHHHVLLFNCSFPDAVPMPSRKEAQLHRSAELEQLWPFGFSSIGEVSFESAGYVARYALKKVKGERAKDHYKGRVPEYLTMSRRPGLGRGWIERFHADVYPSGELVVNGRVCSPPRFYDDVASKVDLRGVELAKARRMAHAAEDPDATGARLVVREVIKAAATAALRRELETS